MKPKDGELRFRTGNSVEVMLTGGGILRLRGTREGVAAVLNDEDMRRLAAALLAKSAPTVQSPPSSEGAP